MGREEEQRIKAQLHNNTAARKQREQLLRSLPRVIPDSLTLGLITREELEDPRICKISLPAITIPGDEFMMNSLSDARMGSNEPGKSCTVCDKSSGDCFGHEGKILFEVQKFVNGKIREITTPIFNPNLLGTIVKILNCLCDGCHQLRYTRDFLLRNKVLNFTG